LTFYEFIKVPIGNVAGMTYIKLSIVIRNHI